MKGAGLEGAGQRVHRNDEGSLVSFEVIVESDVVLEVGNS